MYKCKSMKRYLLIILGIILFADVQAQTLSTVKGFVFEDTNKNGVKDKQEKGLPDISVSNGVDVVKTDNQGYYQLPVGDDNIIFVIKPTGYQTPLNEDNLPRFYYIHKPDGSPQSFKYQGVPATGNLPESVDFPLLPFSETDNFTALLFGDPQPYSEKEVEYFAQGIVSEVEDIKGVSFGISLGDIAGDNLDLHLPYKKAVKNVGIPWYNVIGNHDMNYDAKTDILSDETFERNFGPANFSFNYGKAHFVILDDILYPDPRKVEKYWAGFRKDQLDFIENDLKYVNKDRLIVLVFHIPLLNENNSFRLKDRQKLFSLLKDYPNVLAISAHMHTQQHNFYGVRDGWLQHKPLHEYNAGTTSGDWYSGDITEHGVPDGTMRDGTPRGYAFLNISGNQYTIDYKVAGKSKDYQIQIFNPKVVGYKKRTSSKIYANFFMGTQNDAVEYRIDGGDWKQMDWTETADPAYLNNVFSWDLSDELKEGKRPSNPVLSTHIWMGNIATDLSIGIHEIEVRATDMFGRTYTQKNEYKIME